MATIRFLSSCTNKTITVPTSPGERPTLLAIARDHGVPILFNCVTGDCGACVVHLETRSTGTTEVPPLSEKEKFLLRTMVLLTAADVKNAETGGVPPDVRLACQYRPGDEDIVVMFESGFS
jgi:ferredoxin